LTYFGSLGQDLNSDPDGDGYTVAQEFALGLNPLVWEPKPQDEYVDGGISYARATASTIMDLQPFERLQYLLVDGVVSNFFTGFSGTDGVFFGANVAPALGDWDGDGDLDLFVAFSPGQVRVFENIGSRYSMNLTERTANFTNLSYAWSGITAPALALGDWNGDGRADLVVGGSVSSVRLISSTGNFKAPQSAAVDYTLATGSTDAIPALADMNGDGRVDLLLLLADGTINVYTNTGNANAPFVAPPAIINLLGQSVPNASGLAVADINYDGRLDVLVSDVDGRIWDFQANESLGSFTLMSKVWAGTGAGFAHGLTIATGDLDGNGNIDLVGGDAEGGLLALRDPNSAVPGDLRATGGATSIFLSWDPDTQSRIVGYQVYRSVLDTNNFTQLNPVRVDVPRYEDFQPVAGSTNYYRVTAVSTIIYPGNSVSQYVESRPSEIVNAAAGGMTLWMSDYYGKPGSNTVLRINTPLATGIVGTNMEIHISYDPTLLTPLSQIDSSQTTVKRTALTEGLTISDNGATATGELVITGLGGIVVAGQGKLFDVNFRIAAQAAPGAKATNTFTSVNLHDSLGNPVSVNDASIAVFTVANTYFPGDVDGDGVLSQADFTLVLKLAVGQRPATAREIAAGDLNGNGIIDKDDAYLILQMLEGQSPNPK